MIIYHKCFLGFISFSPTHYSIPAERSVSTLLPPISVSPNPPQWIGSLPFFGPPQLQLQCPLEMCQNSGKWDVPTQLFTKVVTGGPEIKGGVADSPPSLPCSVLAVVKDWKHLRGCFFHSVLLSIVHRDASFGPNLSQTYTGGLLCGLACLLMFMLLMFVI